MALTLRDPVVYAVLAHSRGSASASCSSFYGRPLYASVDDARAAGNVGAAGAEARAAGEFDEAEVRAYHVAAPGASVHLGPVELDGDPHLGKPVVYAVEGHGSPLADDHWFETCGDVLYASLDDAKAHREQIRASGKYDEVVILSCPVAGPSKTG